MKISLWNASLVPGEEERKGRGSRFLGQVCDRGCQEEATSWRSWNSCRREPHTFPEEECPDGCFGNCASQFSSCMENTNVLEMVQSPASPILCDHFQRDAAILKEDSCHCSPAEEEWQILWAGPWREVQQESYTSSGSKVKTIKVQAVK